MIAILSLGMFLAFIFAGYYLHQNLNYLEYREKPFIKRLNPFKKIEIIFSQTPTKLVLFTILLFCYCFFNFFYCLKTQPYTPSIINNQYVLHNHGTIEKILTIEEYHLARAKELKLISGHWMAFYGIAAVIIFTKKNNRLSKYLNLD